MWEDDRNKDGGRWLVNSNKSQRQELDRIWLETVSTSNTCVEISVNIML